MHLFPHSPLRRALVVVALASIASATGLGAQNFRKSQPARISVAASVTKASVTPGQSVDLTLDVTPVPGVHVYAPGNPKYIAVAITTTPLAGIHVDPAVFPSAEDLFFAPLSEAVKVYSKPFTVRVPIHVEATIRKGAVWPGPVTLAGTVDYQACDDRVCFPPQSAPFSARLNVERKRH
jgi:DsbC/DsbD-like thiol-disulfide interchange protein